MSWADETSVTVEISKSRKFDRFVEALVWSSRKYRSLNGRQLRDFVCQIFGNDDLSMDKSSFLCYVELARKTGLCVEEIDIIATRRTIIVREPMPELNTFNRWLVFWSRKNMKFYPPLSGRDLRDMVCQSFGTDDSSLTKEDFLFMVKMSQITPLTAEEIEIILNYRKDNPRSIEKISETFQKKNVRYQERGFQDLIQRKMSYESEQRMYQTNSYTNHKSQSSYFRDKARFTEEKRKIPALVQQYLVNRH